jgi:ABC-type antimicrobial peptide transport system permease subunit
MKKYYRTFKTAVNALRRNVMRSALTTLGIVIGVAAVIVVIEIGQGSSAAVKKTIASMGADILLVQPGTASSGGVTFGSGSVMTLTPDDADAILRECPSIVNVAPVVRARTQVVYGNRNWVPLFIYGTTPTFLEVRDWQDLDAGEAFTDREVRNGSKVCMIGQTLARELFQGETPVGKEIRVQNAMFKVIGVLARKGANMMGMDQDDILLAPWTTIKYRVAGTSATTVNQSAAASAGANSVSTAVTTLNQLYPYLDNTYLYDQPSSTQTADTPQPIRFANVDQIMSKAETTAAIPEAMREITGLLHERHHIRPGQSDDFNIRDMTEMTRALASTSYLMAVLLLVVGLVSLGVGGVGIMNIMLVSVTERTREIGLRMAVGARARDILRQFLVEAIVLCLVGGAMGIMIGRGFSSLVRIFLHWPTEPSLLAILLSVAVSAAVGLIFGYYPAWKASRLDPIEALRYE